MVTPRRPLPRTNGFAFVLIVWLLLALLSGGGVWWTVSQVQAAGQTVAADPADVAAPEAEPTGGSSVPSAALRSDDDPAPRRRTTTTTTTTTRAQADPNDPYMQGWVLVIDNCYQNDCSYDEAYADAAAKWDPADFEVIDSNTYTGLKRGVWAVVARDLTWSSKAAAQEACPYYGLEAGGDCYGREPRRANPNY